MIAVLLNRDSVAAATQVQDIEAAAHALGRKVHILHVNTEAAVEAILNNAIAEKAGGLLVTSDVVFNTWYQAIVALANSHRLPTIYPQRLHAAAGGLMSYGTNLADAYHQTGVYVGRILKGEKIADLPVLQSIKFEFIINLKTAAALDVTIPPGVLAIADEVIE
jgi:putative tryptophan/tyrosine transport system substrate-binding protein